MKFTYDSEILVKNSYSRFYEAPHDDLVVGAR
jgi:hypothetical protein